jgi:tetratricopeptide (TPR) repeat protein
VKPLEPPDSFHLSAAVGWLELGNWREADEELEKIAPALRAHPDVLEIRWAIHAKAGKWEQCVDIGNDLINADAENSSGWIHRSFALHELKRTQEAADLLVPAAALFPEEWLIRYNLACYACQLGDREEAWKWLKMALSLGDAKQVKLMALNDPDLKPLRTENGGFDPKAGLP